MAIVLFQPEIAGNFGNILRSCAALNSPLHVVEPLGFPLAARDVRRAAMDYGRAVELTRHPNWNSYARIAARRVLFTTSGAVDLCDAALRPGDHLVFGRESAGVPDTVHAACDVRVRVPLADGARSLNLANTVAIALWERLRQSAAR